MNENTSTRLWLATISVATSKDDEDEGVLTQKIVIAQLSDDADTVRRSVSQLAKDRCGSRSEVKSLAPVPSVAALPRLLCGMDLIRNLQFAGVDRRYIPTSVVLEMGYDDYGPCDQTTPSRIESLLYPNRELAEAAEEHALKHISEQYPEYSSYWTTRIDVGGIHTVQADAIEAVEGLIDAMMNNYIDNEHA